MPQTALSNKKFGFSFAVIFLVLGVWLVYTDAHYSMWLFILSGLTFLIAAFKSDWLSVLNKKWMAFGFFLQKHLNPVFMGIIYLSVFTFVGLIIRIFKRNYLGLKMEPKTDSYWIKSSSESLSTMKDQF